MITKVKKHTHAFTLTFTHTQGAPKMRGQQNGTVGQESFV